MEIKLLGKTDFEMIIKSFTKDFADYNIQINAEEHKTMWIRQGFNPDLSFAAFEEEKNIAFTLNEVGNFNGTEMAYDTVTGNL